MTATSPASVVSVRESETAARAIGIKLVIFNASSRAEIEAAFAKIVQARLGALLVGADPLRHNAVRVGVSTAALHARGSLEGSFSPTETTFGFVLNLIRPRGRLANRRVPSTVGMLAPRHLQ
jgi:hypothetical protein